MSEQRRQELVEALQVDGIHEILKQTFVEIRNLLQNDEKLPNFAIKITASGRVHAGDMKIEYAVGENTYSGLVEGGQLSNVVTEFLRRRGWQYHNQAKAITYSGEDRENVFDDQAN